MMHVLLGWKCEEQERRVSGEYERASAANLKNCVV
jgi:hypothetical protein